MKNLGKKFWFAMVMFGLIGQVAWVVENMYLNVFIYKMFHAQPADISLMVGASSVAATVTTILIGALSDRLGKRKAFMCGGYLIWGVIILGFGFVRMDILTPVCETAAQAVALGILLVIILDCVMTFFGSAANDAAYNAWLTDMGDDSNRGKIEGINAMMPLISILLVFGGFMGFDLELADSWTTIFIVIGVVVFAIGIAGIFLVDESQTLEAQKDGSYWENILYSFKLSTLKENKLLYAVIGSFALFCISIQTFMPYLIVYYEKTLQMTNYVIVFAPAIVIAAVVTAIYGRLYDQLGFQKSIVPVVALLVAGYVILLFTETTVPVFIGTVLMLSGYLSGMAVFGAKIREHIPDNMAGRFQGARIIGQVLIPGVIGSAIGAFALRNAQQIENSDGTLSFLPNKNIWVAAILTAGVLAVALHALFTMIQNGHYDLWTESGERLLEARKRGEKNPWDVYPRPQMRRESYMMLNENWTLNGKPICMPFPPQSMLSGYEGKVGDQLTYETSIQIPESFSKDKILLHFGAVDQIAEVWVNGKLAGKHEGGYLPFYFDITSLVSKKAENKVVVKVTDTLNREYPYGKQCKKRGGMWYTPVSGIWQSVWLENVPASYIEKIVIRPDLEGIDLSLVGTGMDGFSVEITLPNGEILKESFTGTSGRINISAPVHWCPENPYLYEMKITTADDCVESYFALRTIEIKKINGVNRVCLNGTPIFMHGVLDQGYYPDGIFLPAEPEEFERDILRMKEVGMNFLRKHIKVEPESFYYYCDKHGMLVMQDMVNNGGYSFFFDTALPTVGMKQKDDTKRRVSKRTKDIFEQHMKDTIAHVYNHPSIIAYTLFNEGWGQFESDRIFDIAKECDDTRLMDATSGWFAQFKNDFDSEHIYFKVIDLDIKERPMFVSETGGYSNAVEGHYYSKYNVYGYGGSEDAKALTKMITDMYAHMILPGIKNGACGCVYTQLSDVEDEVNGLYTYDRKVCKVVKEDMQKLSAQIMFEIKKA